VAAVDHINLDPEPLAGDPALKVEREHPILAAGQHSGRDIGPGRQRPGLIERCHRLVLPRSRLRLGSELRRQVVVVDDGVLGVLPGLIGTIQAAEAIKLIIGAGQTLAGRLLVGVGVLGALAIAVLFFAPFELRANLTLTGTVTVLALWVASWVVFVADPPRSAPEERYRLLQAGAREAGVPFDGRTPLQVLDDLRADGIDAYPPLSAWSLFPDEVAGEADPDPGEPAIVPLAGPSWTTTVLCNEIGEHLVVETDRYGFNNPGEAYTANSPVIMLGDSFAFGYCVRPGDDIAGQLRGRSGEDQG
jgi:hypothetical protein